MEIGSALLYQPRPRVSQDQDALNERALMLWPRLDRRRLSRCGGDPRRISRLVAERTTLPQSAILAMLLGTAVDEDEIATWFG